MTKSPLLLTLSIGGISSRKVWTGEKPLRLGRSRRWILERSVQGARLRHLDSSRQRTFTFDEQALLRGTRVEVEDASIQLRTRTPLPAAFQSCAQSGSLRVYHRARGWTLDARDVGQTYTGYAAGTPVFSISKTGDTYRLTALSSNPIRLWNQQGNHELRPYHTLELSGDELSHLSIRAETYDWSFNRPEASAPPDPRLPPRRHLAVAGSLAATFLLVGLLWPTPEIIPEQKPAPLEITLIPSARLQAKAGLSQPRASARAAAPAVFQDTKLQSTLKGLFQGGMPKLLARSEFGPGADRSDSTRKLFNTRSPEVHSSTPLTGPAIGQGAALTSLGGGGGGSGHGGVGYGQGEHANVQGQGSSLVAMDTSGSLVEEGLTKDEVGKVIHRHLTEVRYCYEASIVRQPDLEGKLVLGFTINGAGNVKIAEVRESTLTDARLDDCIVRRLSGWKFPNTKGGIDVAVTYPFIFKTLGG